MLSKPVILSIYSLYQQENFQKNSFQNDYCEGFAQFLDLGNDILVFILNLKTQKINIEIKIDSPAITFIDYTESKKNVLNKYITTSVINISANSDANLIIFQFPFSTEQFPNSSILPFPHEIYSYFQSVFKDERNKTIKDLIHIYKLMTHCKKLLTMKTTYFHELSTISEIDLINILQTETHEIKSIEQNGLISPIETLSEQCCMSQTKFKRLFKIIFQETPHSYFHQFKMNLAKNMVLNKQYSVSEVSSKLGYKSFGKFSTAFYQQYKILPSQSF